MAKLPTAEETGARIVEILKGMGVRAGQVAPVMAVQQHLGPDYRRGDIEQGLEHLLAIGQVEEARAGFVKLTSAGYGPEPEQHVIKRAVLDIISRFCVRAGEVVPTQAIATGLMQQAYTSDEIADAMDSLAADGFLDVRNGTPFLTEAGFEAL